MCRIFGSQCEIHMQDLHWRSAATPCNPLNPALNPIFIPACRKSWNFSGCEQRMPKSTETLFTGDVIPHGTAYWPDHSCHSCPQWEVGLHSYLTNGGTVPQPQDIKKWVIIFIIFNMQVKPWLCSLFFFIMRHWTVVRLSVRSCCNSRFKTLIEHVITESLCKHYRTFISYCNRGVRFSLHCYYYFHLKNLCK